MHRHIFILSDGTGITAENLANSLLSQFENINFKKLTLPYIDNEIKAQEAVARINKCFHTTGIKPLVFVTLVNKDLVKIITEAKANIFDLFNIFIEPLEQALNIKSSYRVGKAHSAATNSPSYLHRMDAVNYTLTHDDGINIKGYDKADIILLGVSRCGKTPSCLYMALHFDVLAANYPFTEEDLNTIGLPLALQQYKSKLFGLTIDPIRLQQIRNERRPNSKYSSLEQCKLEVAKVETLLYQEKIPYLNSTTYSIEEITTKILAAAGIKRH